MIASVSFCLQMVVGGPSHRSLTLALEGGLSEAVAAEPHAAQACGEGGICVWLGGWGALCSSAQVGKYVRQAPGYTHPPRGCTPTPPSLGRKGGIVRAG